MARVESVSLVDDLDGGVADETVAFSLDGKELEIDLSSTHATELREALAPYVGAARRITATRPHARAATTRTTRTAGNREENGRIRAWALEQGMKVSERGRIPSEVLHAYADRAAIADTAPRPSSTTAGKVADKAAEFSGTSSGDAAAATEKPKRRSRKKATTAA
ncbi:Lsr2 protein [Pseudonocardia oroxyli]|uniref:Lsr2 protein n=1 Tax=Pseudonocardia oroxyli TaxID=366584 RepID=A0A1G7SYE8_PSEOR|nr:Lsr2 protein [Pseudonocardia oroxyli]